MKKSMIVWLLITTMVLGSFTGVYADESALDETETVAESAESSENESVEIAENGPDEESDNTVAEAAAPDADDKETSEEETEEIVLQEIPDTAASAGTVHEFFPGDSLDLMITSMSAACEQEEAQFGITSGKEGWYHLVLDLNKPVDYYRYFIWHRDDSDTVIETKQYNQSDISSVDCYIYMRNQCSFSFGLYFEGLESADISAEFTYVGTVGDAGPQIDSSFDADSGTLTLSGSGGMWDEFDVNVWQGKSWGFDIKKLVIGEGVTRIGNGMFSNQYYLEEVSFPSTLEEIGKFAFGCSGPQDNDRGRDLYPEVSACTFDVPEGVLKIDSDAFANRRENTVLLPRSLETVNGRIFSAAPGLCTLYVYEGSYAEIFAKEEGYKIVYRGEHTHSYDAAGFCTKCGEFKFTDIPASSTKSIKKVSWAYEKGIVVGTGENTFSPDASCTKLQFVMMLWKMNGEPAAEGVTNPFSDVTGSKSEKAVKWALKEGIINSGSRFNAKAPITRAQIVMILWKMAGSETVKGSNPFADIKDGTKLCKAVKWAYKYNITSGTSSTTFSPDNNCTRLQLVFFLYEYNEQYKLV